MTAHEYLEKTYGKCSVGESSFEIRKEKKVREFSTLSQVREFIKKLYNLYAKSQCAASGLTVAESLLWPSSQYTFVSSSWVDDEGDYCNSYSVQLVDSNDMTGFLEFNWGFTKGHFAGVERSITVTGEITGIGTGKFILTAIETVDRYYKYSEYYDGHDTNAFINSIENIARCRNYNKKKQENPS